MKYIIKYLKNTCMTSKIMITLWNQIMKYLKKKIKRLHENKL